MAKQDPESTDAVPESGTVIPTAEPDANEAAVERPPMTDLSWIKFSAGQVDVKTFTASDLRTMGLDPKSEDDLVWSRANGFVVPIDAVNAATLDAIIKLPGFSAT